MVNLKGIFKPLSMLQVSGHFVPWPLRSKLHGSSAPTTEFCVNRLVPLSIQAVKRLVIMRTKSLHCAVERADHKLCENELYLLFRSMHRKAWDYLSHEGSRLRCLKGGAALHHSFYALYLSLRGEQFPGPPS